jgi:transcriptional regulator
MYLPKSFQESDLQTLHAFMRRYPFATVISHDEGAQVSHIPLLVRPQPEGRGTLLGHVARANRHWRAFDGERTTICVFHGPHAYVSPSWYQALPAVPTWNYAVVHATGRPRIVEDPRWMAQLMEQTLQEFEPALLDPEVRGHPPQELRAQLLQQIVGFEMPIDEIEGKFKLGQNRSAADQASIAEHLRTQPGDDGPALVELMRQWSAAR